MAARKRPGRTTELNFDDVTEKPQAPEPREELWRLPLLEFIEAASGGRIAAPTHLAEAAALFERAERRECDLRAVVDAPVQHGKTTLVEWGIAWLLLRHPDWPGMYITYDVRKAEKHSRRIRTIFLDNGGQIKADFNTIHQWETVAGGGLLATSRDGDMTGNSAAFVLFDDPYKNFEEASDADTRERLEEKYASEVETRMAPNGFIGIIASRWHESDLSGTKIAAGFAHVHLEAIRVDEHGEEQALCPWGPDAKAPRTLEWLRGRRAALIESGHESTWWSLYQGAPRPTGSGVFGDATWHEGELPPMVRWAWGVDLAFSAGAKGDRTAVVLLGLGADGIVYVLLVWSVRQGIVECKPSLRGYLGTMPEAPIATYASGPEVGSYQAMAVERDPVRVLVMPARYSKYVRAKRTAGRWNAGQLRVPSGRPWAPAFVRLVKGFTGADGDVDDEVDALVAAHDRLMGTSAGSALAPSDFLMGRRVM
jgi:phage terminase large subunit-like protein